jgi:para-aminobenzoate synthetase component 1
LTIAAIFVALALAMKTLSKPYSLTNAGPETLFPSLATAPGSVWLDSSLAVDGKGHTSIIAAHPTAELRLEGDSLTIRENGKPGIVEPSADIISFLDCLTDIGEKTAIGYISYEAMNSLLGLGCSTATSPIPKALFYIYDSVIKYDHITGLYDPASFETESGVEESLSSAPYASPARLTSQMDRDEYLRRVREIKRHIAEGDIYQANFTCRFEANSSADPFTIYRRLRELNPAPYGGFFNFGDFHILSSSPERMFYKRGDSITSSPIKGTIDCGENQQEQTHNLNRLLNSAKDRAELLMIVDLVRNDLGKIARTGTVGVDHLFRPEVYSSLIHLVADISAVTDDVTITEICRALLPGGSITGAPKKRAVEILNELETVPRSVYTGCIGYISGDTADFNIAIRTMYASGNTWYLHAGGGIVADSDPEAEYREMLLKARNLFRALRLEV